MCNQEETVEYENYWLYQELEKELSENGYQIEEPNNEEENEDEQ